MNLDDLNTVQSLPYDWAKVDYTDLENRVSAVIAEDPQTDLQMSTYANGRTTGSS